MQHQFKQLDSIIAATCQTFISRFMRQVGRKLARSGAAGAMLISAFLFAAPQASALTAQSINFAPLPTVPFGTAPFALTVTASSNLTVALTSITSTVCTVSGSTVTLLAVGTCTIAADQAGDGTYSAAPEVTQSFAVSSGIQSISYIYDAVGRAVQVVDTSGVNTQFTYDSVGNISAVSNFSANSLTLTEFSPASGDPGTSVTINGSGYDSTATNNIVSFNGVAATVTSATPTSLSVVVPPGATTGTVSITNGNGSVISAASFGVGPSLVAGNLPNAVNLSPNQSKTFSFAGSAGQGLTLGFSGVSFTPSVGNLTVTVAQPNGSPLPAFSCTINADSSCVLPYLPATGIYTVILKSAAAVTVNIFLVPDTVGALTANSLSHFTVTTLDQGATYTFAGTAGQTAQLAFTADSIYGATLIQVFGPTGSYLQSINITGGLNSGGSGLLTLFNLAASGTYTVRLLPPAKNAGGSVNVLMVPAGTGAIAADSAATAVSLSVGEIGLYTFAGTAGQSLGLGLSGISTTPAGAALSVNVNDPSGNVIATFNTSGTNSGAALPILTIAGTYTITVNPGTNAATFNMQLSSDLTGSLAIGGTSTSFTTGKVGQAGTYTFNGTANQNLDLLLSADTLSGSTSFYVIQPDGTLLATLNVPVGSSSTLPLTNLPTTGTYTVRVQPSNGATGSVVLGLQPEADGTITVGGSATTVNLVGGQIGRFTFNGTIGQSLGLGMTGLVTTPAGASLLVTINDPSGTSIGTYSATTTASGYALPILASSGTYTVLVNPGTNSASFNLQMNLDLTGSISAGGPAANFTTSIVGQDGSYTFSGVAGQNLDLLLSGSTFIGTTTVNVYQPNGQLLSTFGEAAGTSALLSLTNLPATGTYVARLIPQNGAIGTASLSLQVEAAGGVAVNGSATAESLGAGQTGRYTFAGTAGQLLGLGVTGLVTAPANGTINVTVDGPNGNAIASFNSAGTNSAYILPPLTSTGNYSVLVNPGANAATYNLQVNSDVTGSITANGGSVTFSPTVIGQAATYTFSGTAGQALSFLIANDTLPGQSTYTVFQPNGVSLASTNATWSSGTPASASLVLANLPATGTYTIRVVPANATGSTTLSLLSATSGGALTVDGSATTANLTSGQPIQYTFNGTAGQNIGLGLSGVSVTSGTEPLTVSVTDPSGNAIAGFSTSSPLYGYSLPPLATSGTYSVAIVSGGSATFTLQMSSNVTGAIAIDGGPITFSTSEVGQGATYSFNANAGQDLGLLIGGNTFSNATISVSQPNGQIVYPPLLNAPIIPSSTSVSWSGPGPGTTGNLELANLPATGTYVIHVMPTNGATGSMNLSLSSEVSKSITLNDTGTTFTLAPGQIGKLTFNAAGGQNIGIGLSASVANTVTVTDPLGSIVAGLTTTTQQLTLNQQALGTNTVGLRVPSSVSGQYSVLVYANATGGNFTAWASSSLSGVLNVGANVDSQGALTNQTSVTTTSPGQEVIFSFNATAGQNLGLVALIPPPACSNCAIPVSAPGGAQGMTDFSVYSPSGVLLGTLVEEPNISLGIALPSGYYDNNGTYYSEMLPAAASGGGGGGGGNGVPASSVSLGTSGWMPLNTLTETGTYTVVTQTAVGLAGVIGGVGVVPYAAGTVAVDGGATVSNLVIGQGATYTFAGTAGQNLEVEISSQSPQLGAVAFRIVTITDPNGGLVGTFTAPALVNGGPKYAFSLPTLLMSGAYVVSVSPGNTEALSVSVSSDASLTLGGSPSSQPASLGGQITYLFSGTAGQTVSVALTNDTYNGDTKFMVYQPNGSVLTNTTLTYNGVGNGTNGSMILKNLPTTGTYKLTIIPPNGVIGNVAVALVPELAGGAITANSSTPVSLQPGQEGIYTFSGAVGQIVDLALKGVATTPAGGAVTMTVTKPDGSNLTSFSVSDGKTAANLPAALTQAGTYTITVTAGGYAANANVVLSTDVTATLTLDGPAVPVTLSLPGQAATLTFNGTTGQTVSFLGTGDTIPGYFLLQVYQPNGTLIANNNIYYSGSGATGTGAFTLTNLPVTGVYTVRGIPTDGWGTNTAALGNISLALGSEVTGTLPLNGTTAVNLQAGQEGLYTFTGAVGQIIDFAMTGVKTAPASGTVTMTVTKPDGSNLFSYDVYDGRAGANLPAALTQAGTYIAKITASGTDAASVNVTLSTDVTAALTLDGPATPATLSLPGQAVTYTFNGTVGQTVSLLATGDTIPGYFLLQVYQPNGTLIANNSIYYSGSGAAGTGTFMLTNLPATGVYTIRGIPTDGWGTNTAALGSISLALESEVTGALSTNGTTMVNLEAGQEGIYTFTGAVGQILDLAMTDVKTTPAGGTVTMAITMPDGSNLTSFAVYDGRVSANLPAPLTQAGAYTAKISASGTYAESVNIVMSTDVTAALTLNGSSMPVTLSLAGQAATYTFSGTAGQTVNVLATGDTIPGYFTLHVYQPNGTEISYGNIYFGGSGAAGTGTLTLTNLPATGTYTIRGVTNDGWGDYTGATGSISLGLTN